jgi:hypothetical protein
MGDRRYLEIYLNDHLGGAAAGVQLARRIAGHNEGTEAGVVLAAVRDEIEADRDTLESLMDHLGVDRSRFKPAAGWVLERLGRLKPNGHLLSDSPLGYVLEMEGLIAGITAKMLLWRSLERVLAEPPAGFNFAALAERAESQRERVEAQRLGAAARALA